MGSCILPSVVSIDDGTKTVTVHGHAAESLSVSSRMLDEGPVERTFAAGNTKNLVRIERRSWEIRGRGPIPTDLWLLNILASTWNATFPDPDARGALVSEDVIPVWPEDMTGRLSDETEWLLTLNQAQGVLYEEAPAPPVPTCWIQDTFVAPDGTYLKDHTPDSGGPWATGSDLGDTWPRIASQRAYMVAGEANARASVDAAADLIITAEAVVYPTSQSFLRLSGRWDGAAGTAGRDSLVALILFGTVYLYLEQAGQPPALQGSFSVASITDIIDMELTFSGTTLSGSATNRTTGLGASGSIAISPAGANLKAGFSLTSATESPGWELDSISICPPES